MRPRFLLDHCTSDRKLMRGLRMRGRIEVVAQQAAGISISASDTELLRQCAADSYVLVTKDRGMGLALRALTRAGERSAGIIVIPRTLGLAKILDDLEVIWKASEAEEWLDRMEWLPL